MPLCIKIFKIRWKLRDDFCKDRPSLWHFFLVDSLITSGIEAHLWTTPKLQTIRFHHASLGRYGPGKVQKWPFFGVHDLCPKKFNTSSSQLTYRRLFCIDRIRQRLGYILVPKLCGYVTYMGRAEIKTTKILISKNYIFLIFSTI